MYALDVRAIYQVSLWIHAIFTAAMNGALIAQDPRPENDSDMNVYEVPDLFVCPLAAGGKSQSDVACADRQGWLGGAPK
jgi:hypothetical protein